MASSKLTINVEKMPEMIARLRLEFSNLLREEAEAEADPRIARRLREIAAIFEVGGKA